MSGAAVRTRIFSSSSAHQDHTASPLRSKRRTTAMSTVADEHIPLFPGRRSKHPHDARCALVLLLALGAPFGAIAQAISEPLRGAEIVSDAARARRQARGKRALLRSRGRPVRLQLLSREPPRLPADPHRGDRAGGRLRRRSRRHVPPAAPGSRRRRLGAARHIGRRRVRDAERHVGCIRPAMPAGGSTGACARSSGSAPDSSISISTGSGPRHLRSTRAVRYSLQFSGGGRAGELATRTQVPVGRRPALRLRRRGPQATRRSRSFQGLADQVRVKISAPTAIVEFDTRDNVFTPTRGIYAESSWLASREALGASDDFERFQQVLIGWHPLTDDVTLGARANYAWSSDGTPFFLRPFVQLRGRARDALSGRPGGVGRARGALAVLRPLERRRVWRRRHDANRSANASSPRRTSAAEASASATSWQASSGCTPASTSRTAPGRPRSISWWAMRGSGPEKLGGLINRRGGAAGSFHDSVTRDEPAREPGTDDRCDPEEPQLLECPAAYEEWPVQCSAPDSPTCSSPGC